MLDGKIATASRPIAVQGLYGKTGKLKDGLTERLAGNRARMNGHASHHDRPVNDGNAFTRFCCGDGTLLPRWATADHNKVVLCCAHFENLLVVSRLRYFALLRRTGPLRASSVTTQRAKRF